MADTNAFNNPDAVAAAQPAAAKGSGQKSDVSASAGRAPGKVAAGPRSAPAAPKYNPKTAVSGVPHTVGMGQRQNDGTRSPITNPPTKRGGLAERQSSPAPQPGSSDRRSGLEAAMGDLADKLHKRSAPKYTKR